MEGTEEGEVHPCRNMSVLLWRAASGTSMQSICRQRWEHSKRSRNEVKNQHCCASPEGRK